ncbi:MAG: hypothetical protein JWO44_2011 [Bacteroidetes bacterium]|jgi:hypothetical protein|nr:hypothetical protein [Bacteroidota bacterium]
MRFFLAAFIFLFPGSFARAQADSTYFIKVHFLYGSRPLKKYRDTEAKYFGGIHGGHVSIEVDSADYGFVPEGKFHIFTHRGSCHSAFITKQTHNRDPYTDNQKVTTFIIPVTAEQHDQLLLLVSDYCSKVPYDYAFFGMRCAAASQDVLGKIGVVKPRGRLSNIYSTFYPKKLRRRMFRLAKEKHYKVISREGRTTRKWESD